MKSKGFGWFWPKNQVMYHKNLSKLYRFLVAHGSRYPGQIIIFHQPRCLWNKGKFLTKPPFGVKTRVRSRANLTRKTKKHIQNPGPIHFTLCQTTWKSVENHQLLPPGSLTYPLKIGNPKRKLMVQPSIFRGYVKLPGGIGWKPRVSPWSSGLGWVYHQPPASSIRDLLITQMEVT